MRSMERVVRKPKANSGVLWGESPHEFVGKPIEALA
jgi:hypothetical protein